jgi:hypothetical protein
MLVMGGGEVVTRFTENVIGWRNEQYQIYGTPQSPITDDAGRSPLANKAFTLERSACALFGLATYGVHMTGEHRRGLL